jgi:hypothetical protein
MEAMRSHGGAEVRLPLLLALAAPALLVWGCSSSSNQPATVTGQQQPPDAGRMAVHMCAADAACPTATDAAAGSGGGSGTGGTGVAGCVPSPEMCDGKDDDCDGVVDNGFSYQGTPVGGPCYSAGQGACITMGRVTCVSPSAAGCSAMPAAPDDTFHTTAAPNGSWDWNCNNNVDRKYPLAACESFSAANCPAQGWQPPAGQAGDCGAMLIQQSCTATATGCASTGAPMTVTEGCK